MHLLDSSLSPGYMEKKWSHMGRVAFIEQVGQFAIYYHEALSRFSLQTSGVFEVRDQEHLESILFELNEGIIRRDELEDSRGHGAVWMKKVETVVGKLGSAPPEAYSNKDLRAQLRVLIDKDKLDLLKDHAPGGIMAMTWVAKDKSVAYVTCQEGFSWDPYIDPVLAIRYCYEKALKELK